MGGGVINADHERRWEWMDWMEWRGRAKNARKEGWVRDGYKEGFIPRVEGGEVAVAVDCFVLFIIGCTCCWQL